MRVARRYVKRKIKIKIFLGVLALILIPLLFVSCISMFTLFTAGADEIETMKEIDIPYVFLTDAYGYSKDNDINSFSKLLAISLNEANLDKDKLGKEVLIKAGSKLEKRDKLSNFEEYLYMIYRKVYDDIETGPIPEKKIEEYKEEYIDPETGEEKTRTRKDVIKYSYTSTDDFGADRSYGGERRHLGNDIMSDMGTPIVSMTDGVIEKMGWDELGGWRIGILTNKDTYFYYAHMSEYEKGLDKGDRVYAGDVIGYVGDSGYGPVGTTGTFEPHLHLQIGIKLNDNDDNYTWMNPYNIVRFMDDFRTVLGEDDDD